MRGMRLLLAAIGLTLLAAQSQAADPVPKVAYVALSVFDEKRSLDFYVGVLGMSERRRITPSPALTEILLGFTKYPNDAGVLLMVRSGRDKPYDVGDGFSRVILDVANLAATAKHLNDAGVPLVRPITEVKELQLKYAMVRDPDGYLIELVQQL